MVLAVAMELTHPVAKAARALPVARALPKQIALLVVMSLPVQTALTALVMQMFSTVTCADPSCDGASPPWGNGIKGAYPTCGNGIDSSPSIW